MSYKPDESTLIAFLYGELEGKEKEAVQQYFQEHPEELKNAQELMGVAKMMSNIQDKEVIAPPIFMDHDGSSNPFWKSVYFKTVVSIAASLLFLLVAGKLIGPDIHYADGELRISFGNVKAQPEKTVAVPQQVLTSAEVQTMINSSLSKTTASLDAHLTENQQKLNTTIRQSLEINSKKVDELVQHTAQASQDQLRAYVASLQTENLQLMKDYFQLTAKEQNDYVENLLIGFSKYVQEQRTQDMLLVQNRVNSLEKNSDQFKQETEQLLATIISNKTIKKNSY